MEDRIYGKSALKQKEKAVKTCSEDKRMTAEMGQ